jgi:GNAT superfamily N-acetyltransferase
MTGTPTRIRPEQIERRPATEADMPFLMDLRRQTMTEHQVNAGVAPSDAERHERVLARYECAEILSRAGRPIGLWKVARDGRDWDLIQIQLLPEYQGLGVGRALIEALLGEAREAGTSVQLKVLKGSPARRLYERLGFVAVAEGNHFTSMQARPGEVEGVQR